MHLVFGSIARIGAIVAKLHLVFRSLPVTPCMSRVIFFVPTKNILFSLNRAIPKIYGYRLEETIEAQSALFFSGDGISVFSLHHISRNRGISS